MNELYDLEADPYEEHNLITDPAARTVLEHLQSELQRQMVETRYESARFTPTGRN
jgi:hypothetical protein